ncbi:hypothetical protein JCM33374_g6273 [Metschnikowia sp. JCM 33374]|nr:hypothetical protein JCM33374_g6273 [Metschnikowia sp. JCM 33374]
MNRILIFFARTIYFALSPAHSYPIPPDTPFNGHLHPCNGISPTIQETEPPDFLELDLYTLPSFDKVPENITLDTDKSLEFVYGHLLSFIDGPYFDEFNFDLMAKKISEDLSDIETLGLGITNHNEILSRKLQFVSLVYEKMLFASDALQYYFERPNVENFLICQILDLNIRVFGSFNSQGYLDTEIDGYFGRLAELYEAVAFFGEIFDQLEKVSFRVRGFFQSQKRQAEERILDLLSQVSP